MSSIPLVKALADAGIGPRRWLTDAMKQGRVRVNGEVVEDFRHPVNVAEDEVAVDGQAVDVGPRHLVYLMLNKPKGVVSTTSDERGRTTVIDILPKRYRGLRLHPVGRLDKSSTGLLLLTNDGELTHRLTHPKFRHEKEYRVSIATRLRPGEKRRLEQGVDLEDGVTHPAVVKEVEAHPFDYSITVHEGRKRQVRRMFASIGHRVLALKRVRIGSLALGELQEGQVRELSPQEVQDLLG